MNKTYPSLDELNRMDAPSLESPSVLSYSSTRLHTVLYDFSLFALNRHLAGLVEYTYIVLSVLGCIETDENTARQDVLSMCVNIIHKQTDNCEVFIILQK